MYTTPHLYHVVGLSGVQAAIVPETSVLYLATDAIGLPGHQSPSSSIFNFTTAGGHMHHFGSPSMQNPVIIMYTVPNR